MKKNGKLIATLLCVAAILVAAVVIWGMAGQGGPNPTDPTNPTTTAPTTQGTQPTTVPGPTDPTAPDTPTQPIEPTVGPTGPTEPDHKHGYTSKVVSPTCTEKGYTVYTCECGASYKEDYTDPLGHAFVSHTTGATCTEAGKVERTCSACGHTETEAIAAMGHDLKTETVEVSCDTDGHIREYCTRCDYEKISSVVKATGHEYGDWIVTKEPTCEKEGSRERICSKCGGKEKRTTGATGHSLSNETIVDATCTEDGKYTATCTVCGKTVTEVLPATGHDWSEWEVTKEATAEENGERHRFCHGCGKEETESYAKCERHNWAKRVMEGSGCTQNDWNEWYCTECGYVGKREGIPGTAPGHDWTDWETTKEPGPGVAGEEKRHCKSCGKEETLPLEPLDENGEKLESYIDPKIEVDEGIAYVYYRYGDISISDQRKTWGDYLRIVVNEDNTVTVVFYDKEGERVEVSIALMPEYDMTCFRINEDGTYDLYGFNGFN